MGLIITLLIGLIVGAIAKFLMPGKDPGGWIVTILLGIAGAYVGSLLFGKLISGPLGAWIASIAGAMILLLAYRLIFTRKGA